MQQTVVCLDFDGTLVDQAGNIHPSDVEILTSEADVLFVPATGRPLHSVRHVFKRTGLFSRQPIPFPLILQNGAAVYRPGEVLHSCEMLEPGAQARLLETNMRHPDVCGLLFSLDKVTVLQANELGLSLARRFDLNTEPFDANAADYEFLKMSFAAKPPVLEKFVAELDRVEVEKYFSLPSLIEMTTTGINKGSVLFALLDAMSITADNVLMAGDGENDLPLFDVADQTFAPASSPTHIREWADVVVDVEKTGILAPMLGSVL